MARSWKLGDEDEETPVWLSQSLVTFPDPQMFNGNGNKANWGTFKVSLMVKMEGNKDAFRDEKTKMLYFLSRLAGPARGYAEAFIDMSTMDFRKDTLNELMEEMETAFGDANTDRQATAQRSMLRLRQNGGTLIAYLAAYYRDIEATGFNEEARKAILENGLDQKMIDELRFEKHDRLTSKNFIELLLKLDSRRRRYGSHEMFIPFDDPLSLGKPPAPPSPAAPPAPPAPPATPQRILHLMSDLLHQVSYMY